jgi:hypothetical protein
MQPRPTKATRTVFTAKFLSLVIAYPDRTLTPIFSLALPGLSIQLPRGWCDDVVSPSMKSRQASPCLWLFCLVTSARVPVSYRHYKTKPATCTVRSRRHGHSKASARAIRAGLDITAQGGWRCTCLHMSGPVLGSSLADSIRVLLPGRVPRLLRAATSIRSHQRGFRLLYLTGHFEPRSVEQLRHRDGQAQHARSRSSLLLLHSGRLAVSSPLRGEPASSVRVTAHCRGATTTTTNTAVFATGCTPRSVGPARHLYKLLSSSPRVCAPLLLRHPR